MWSDLLRLTIVVDIEDAVRASSKASLHDSVVLLEEGRVEGAAEGVGDKLIKSEYLISRLPQSKALGFIITYVLPASGNAEDVL